MREAAADLEFETAARLRDEIKRLQAVELAVADDPFARQSAVEDAESRALETGDGKPKARRRIAKRPGRPNQPKTFGSRAR
jgi:excinuclease ABC subunit B